MPDLQQELASLLAAADFLEESGMQQCKTLRDAVKVLEFIRGGGSVAAVQNHACSEFELRKGNCQLYWAAPELSLNLIAKKVEHFNAEYTRGEPVRWPIAGVEHPASSESPESSMTTDTLMGFPIVEVHGIVPESEIVLGDWSNWRRTN